MKQSKELYAKADQVFKEARELDRQERVTALHARLDNIKKRIEKASKTSIHMTVGAETQCIDFESWLTTIEKYKD